jgi:hypothetical protein
MRAASFKHVSISARDLIEVDYPSIAALAPDVRADMRRLAEVHPQDSENLKATLFLTD